MVPGNLHAFFYDFCLSTRSRENNPESIFPGRTCRQYFQCISKKRYNTITEFAIEIHGIAI